MEFSKEEIERLLLYIEDEEKRVADAKKIVVENTIDFTIWYKYSTSKDRHDYKSLLGIHSPIIKFINDYMPWLLTKEYEGVVITLETLVQSLDALVLEGMMNLKESKKIKEELMRINFNSMLIKW